jgi:hypothetical protein
MNNQPDCYDPTLLFKPQWAYATPPGYRDELYLIPFQFGVPATGQLVQGLTVQMDDDVPFYLRAIVFPQIADFQLVGGVSNPGLVRVYDSRGNPLTDGLVLFMGAWGESGFLNVNAFGFSFEPEVPCDPGGNLRFDFQLSSEGTFAQETFTPGPGSIQFYAALFGAVGNNVTIQLINPGAPNVPLSGVVVTAGAAVHVQITLATNGASVVTSTFANIAALIASSAALSAVIGAVVIAAGTASALAQTPLTGGTNGSTGNIVQGTLIGVKRWRAC